ncbi:hypothetical protein HRbin30_01709 [bacterium HR30]|nr:hypothetical protein HRbin30_01709 [bacterium HR30]
MCHEAVHHGREALTILVVLLCGWVALAALPAKGEAWTAAGPWQGRIVPELVSGSSIERQVRRWVRRTERLSERVADSVQNLVLVLGWLLASSLLFALFTAAIGMLDSRLFRSGRAYWADALRTGAQGVRLFWKSAVDRTLPLTPRLLLGAAWLYWLSPLDLLGEGWGWISCLDDGAVAAGAARVFLYLCPAEVLERHAAEVVVE